MLKKEKKETTKLFKNSLKKPKQIKAGIKRQNPREKSTTGLTEKKGYNSLFVFFFYTNVFVSLFVAGKWRSYKLPCQESTGRLQYHSQNSGGSREAGPSGRLEAAEFLRMALEVLGPSIWGSWETGRQRLEKMSSAWFWDVPERLCSQYAAGIAEEIRRKCKCLNFCLFLFYFVNIMPTYSCSQCLKCLQHSFGVAH